MLTDTHLCNHLAELVICCTPTGTILYANHAARKQCDDAQEGVSFFTLLTPGSVTKGQHFLDAACAATPGEPTSPWELALGAPSSYVVGNFRGYCEDGDIVIIGQLESEQVSAMQREMLALTSELTNAQREQRRQNRALQQALDEQHRLLETIQQLSAPAVPILDGVLLLPLVGHLDSRRAQDMTDRLLHKVAGHRARYVILDVSGIAMIDTSVASHLISTAHALQLLGAQTILVGIHPEIAQTLVHLGVQLQGFIVQSDLHRAVAYVLHHLKEARR